MTHTHRIRKPPPRGGGQNNIIVPTFPCVNFNTAELISLKSNRTLQILQHTLTSNRPENSPELPPRLQNDEQNERP